MVVICSLFKSRASPPPLEAFHLKLYSLRPLANGYDPYGSQTPNSEEPGACCLQGSTESRTPHLGH